VRNSLSIIGIVGLPIILWKLISKN